MPPMADTDMRSLLEFEEAWPRWAGQKDEAIRACFGITPARCFQLLLRVVETPEALAAKPMLVRRLLHRKAAGVAEQRRRRA